MALTLAALEVALALVAAEPGALEAVASALVAPDVVR